MEPHEEYNLEQPPAHIPVFRQLGILALILLLIFGTALLPERSNQKQTDARLAVVPSDTPQNTPPLETTDPFEAISLQANAAFVWDVANQRALYQKNADEQLPLASVTKLMTALVAHELVNQDDAVLIDQLSLQQDGDSGLLEGESFAMKDLIDLTLLTSSNDGAYAMAAAAGALLSENDPASSFVEAMNIRADELGLAQTYFRNPTGLDISAEEAGAYGSARDVTFLMEYILTTYPEILERTQAEFAYVQNAAGANHGVENTNQTVDQIAGLIGSKTGYTDLAGGNLTIAFDAALNRPIVIVVLDSTYYGRFDDVLTLSQAARAEVQKK